MVARRRIVPAAVVVVLAVTGCATDGEPGAIDEASAGAGGAPTDQVTDPTAVSATGDNGASGASGSDDSGDGEDAPFDSAPGDGATSEVEGAGSGDDDGDDDGGVATGGNAASRDADPPTGEPDTNNSGSEGGSSGTDPIEWTTVDERVDVGRLQVPLDHDDPEGEQIELFMARHHALDRENRIGSLLVNPGGPGFGGSDMALFAEQRFDEPLLERFDIIGWDPRGTGQSRPAVDCIDDYDPYITASDSTPDTDAERAEVVASAEEYAELCIARSGGVIEYVGTNNSARDIDAIRAALDEPQISYFGFSYGSKLGATWATLFPDTVRAAVLDGAADPNVDPTDSGLQQLAGFDAAIATFLDRCADDDDCVFEYDDDPSTSLVDLLEQLDADPMPVDPDRPPVNRDVATVAISQAMYDEAYWPALEQSLAAAQNGDASGLLAFHDAYYQRSPDGSYGNELEAFSAIQCADTSERLTVAEADAEMPLYTDVSPLLVPEGSVGDYSCTFLPPAIDPRIDITGDGAGPIVVIGVTGDPATPFESTARMADTLEDGRLVIVDADRHIGYGVNRCVVDVVNEYLIDLEVPDDETECS